MTKNVPPVLPEKRLEKVLAIARADATGVLVCAGASLLLNLAGEDWIMAGFSALAFVAGAMEWHGQSQLREGDVGGLQWLLGAQGCLYTVVAAYAMWRMRHFNVDQYWAQFPLEVQEQLTQQMREKGLDPVADRPVLLRGMNFLICATLVVVSTIYQGGLTWWYRRQRYAITEALTH